jgi:hypothetical protein
MAVVTRWISWLSHVLWRVAIPPATLFHIAQLILR